MHLSNLFEVREFKTVQNLIETTSAKKNLKGTMKQKLISLICQKRERITDISIFFIDG